MIKNIFDETNLGGLKMKNRLVRSATGENLATAQGHIPKDLYKIYEELAQGGVGMVILSFTSVASVDHFREGLLRLWDDSLIPDYKKIVEIMHKNECMVMPQLAMGIYLREKLDGGYAQISTNSMNKEDIEDIKSKFVKAAIRAKKAGFDGVQLHGTHNFVLSSFLSSRTNHRKDEYGGSVEKRAKIILDIIHGIRKEIGDIHISIKLNVGDLPSREFLQICKLLVEGGLDSIEYEGNYSNMIPLLKSVVDVPIILTGGLRQKEYIDQLLNKYEIEYFGMSRPLIREPGLPNRWKDGNTQPSDCRSCGLCMTTYGFRCALK